MVVVVLALMASCSSSDGPPTTTTTEGALIEGVPAERHNAAVREWAIVVAEWNAIPVERRPYETFEEWARAAGKPTTFDEVLAKYR